MTGDLRRVVRAFRWAFALEAGFVAACQPFPSHTPPSGDGSCATMCSSFREAGCSAGEPSPRLAITCEERCEAQQKTRAVAPPIACVTAANGNADAIRACGERCGL